MEHESKHVRKGNTAAPKITTYLQDIAAGIKPREKGQLLYAVKLFQSVARYIQVAQGGRKHLLRQG